MALNDVLADSSFLYSLFNHSTIQHDDVVKAATQLLILHVALTEVAFLFHRSGGVPAVTRFLTVFAAAQPNLETVTTSDLTRTKDIMNAYPAANLDFVDCCIAAVAERLNITRIATLDHRDFGIIRPKHCDYFELIP